MKILRVTVIVVGIMALLACRDRKNRDRENGTLPDTTSANSSSENNMGAGDDRRLRSNSENTDNNREGVDINALYSHLEMDEGQIRTFEKNYQTHIEEMSEEMSDNTRTTNLETERDRILKDILSAEQYRKYQDWTKQQNQ
ncbi:hypothetical protein [Sinomicrobium soli]|uniref:hypothetical protein n=1 Tax=Sinomicrobium sp. N-1-3-6 TaxID=2219864 RepID=UPI000DCD8DB6|nr:hypothetical protein [Sinomicrobium sp. N-1-3-6]RAV28642.1 hypothetical protein DN748_11835 [Sinomicrobium sp. N-1-3-6]